MVGKLCGRAIPPADRGNHRIGVHEVLWIRRVREDSQRMPDLMRGCERHAFIDAKRAWGKSWIDVDPDGPKDLIAGRRQLHVSRSLAFGGHAASEPGNGESTFRGNADTNDDVGR